MKKHAYLVCCILTLIKIPCTLLVPFIGNYTAACANTSLIISLLVQFHEGTLAYNYAVWITLALAWIAALVLLFLGVRKRNLRVFTLIPITLIAFLDCIIPLLFSSIELKTISFFYFLVFLGFIIEALEAFSYSIKQQKQLSK